MLLLLLLRGYRAVVRILIKDLIESFEFVCDLHDASSVLETVTVIGSRPYSGNTLVLKKKLIT